jgi:[acyl-carrier-protein] S-malonyltransferase
MLRRWIDEPQRLWDVVYETLQMGIETIVHVGPDPNILPATYRRLTENVEEQIAARFHLKAISAAVSRPWLQALLPERAALFRAPLIQHVILEDWLLAQSLD